MSKQKKEEIYDNFKDFVERIASERKSQNPNMSVRDFDYIDPDAYEGFVAIPLENVNEMDKHLIERLEEFKTHTKVKTTKSIQSGNLVHTVFIPFKSVGYDDEPKKKQKHGRTTNSGAPSSVVPILYGFTLLLLVIIGLATTKRSDWSFIM